MLPLSDMVCTEGVEYEIPPKAGQIMGIFTLEGIKGMEIEEKFQEGSFGLEVVMDLYECNPKVIRSGKKLEEYTTKLCKLLKMKKFGKTQLPHFGYNEAHTSGYSMLQFIETSSITGHFSELWNSAYINVFSCRDFDTKKCIDFTVAFFGAKRVTKRILMRK